MKSEGSQIGRVVTQLKQASTIKPPNKIKTHRSIESKLDDLQESDFELSSSHPAPKIAHIELPTEEKYSKFSSPATHFKSAYSGKPLSLLFAKDNLATSLSQDELVDNLLSSSARDWEPVKPIKRG